MAKKDTNTLHPPTVPSALIANNLLDSQNAFWCISSPTEAGLEGRMFEVAGQTPFCLNSLNKFFVRERKTGKLKWVFIFQIHVLCTYLSIAATAYKRALQARRCILGHGRVMVPTKFWADKINLPISIFDQGGLFTSILKSHLRPWVVIKFDSAFNCSLMLSSCPVFCIIFSCRSCTSKLNILLTKICYNSLTKMDDPEKILNVKNVLKEN